MGTDNTKYERVIGILRKSKPVMTDPGEMSEKIIGLIRQEKSRVTLPEIVIDLLFGWVYVGWVRKSMITASLAIVLFFGFQQTLLLRRVNALSSKRIESGLPFITSQKDELTNKILFYKMTGSKFSDEKLQVSKEEIDEMIRSLNNLEIQYKEVLDLVKSDPQLKKYVEIRMNELKKANL